MKKFVILGVVLVAAFFGVGGILPALAQVRDLGAMPATFLFPYTLGVFLLTGLGAGAVSYAIGRRKAA